LSRMKGNFQVRFLGGKGGVTRPTYPTLTVVNYCRTLSVKNKQMICQLVSN